MERNNTALTGVKKMIADGIVTQEAAEKYFPELKESEDERIMKELIKFFRMGAKYNSSTNGIPDKDIIAWLEKQGEQKETPCDKCKKELPSHSCQDITELGRCAVEHEQKPADKVEPKFHKGDIVVNKEGNIFKITRIDKDYNGITYACRLTENPIFWFLYYEDEIRLWDITKDAKDGDVLYSIRVKATIIFKKWNSDGKHINAYCALQKGILIKQEMLWDRDFEPATKEQRDTLMKAMADTGYTFDYEKKELKKVEVEELTAFEEAVKDMMDDYRDAIDDNKVTTEEVKERAAYMLSLIPQKPAWSEDDEGICRAIINDIANDKSMCTFDISKGICDEQINWLKSLKERVACEANCTTTKEWSKEDEIWIDRACMLLDELNHLSTLTLAKIPSNVNDIISHLKSIKYRYTWKPSDEQMDVLLSEATSWTKGCHKQIVLESLYNDLKKLREE